MICFQDYGSLQYTRTLAVQYGLGLEVQLRWVRFGGRRAQGVCGEGERIWGDLRLTERLCVVDDLRALRYWLGHLLGCGMRRLLRRRL